MTSRCPHFGGNPRTTRRAASAERLPTIRTGIMTITVGINGFGRIGRSYFRALLTSGADIRVAAVNDLTSAQALADLLKYDSVYGPLPQQVVAEGSAIRVGDTVVEVLSERDPAQLPWRRLGVDVVIESTGVFND